MMLTYCNAFIAFATYHTWCHAKYDRVWAHFDITDH